MARPAADAKLCFYPAHPIAVDLIAKHLYCRNALLGKKHDSINVLDPCAGKGLALRQLSQSLGIPANQCYAVELDVGRAADIPVNMPGVNVIGPASFMGVHITPHAFGLAYVNAPYGSEMGGGQRQEQTFAEKATRMLTPKGILVTVVPLHSLVGNRSFVRFLDANYSDMALYKFPDGEDANGNTIRPYKEVVLFGVKRPVPIPIDAVESVGDLHKMQAHWSGYIDMHVLPSLGGVQPVNWNNGRPSYERETDMRTWEIPLAWKPNVFKKVEFTEDELHHVVEHSPLNRHLEHVAIPPPDRPPLPLDKGHLGLILASGMLDGVVEGPHGCHVVRGSSRKVEYHNIPASTTEENPDTGAVTTRDVFSQRMVTMIRVVEQDGVIRTYSNDFKPEEEGEE